MFKSELEVIKLLRPVVDGFHNNAEVRVGKSTQSDRNVERAVTFFIIVPVSVDRDTSIKALNILSMAHDMNLYFSGSESGLLHGDIENDWLFMTANIQGV